MKKIIGLSLVMLVSSVSLFAQSAERSRRGTREIDPEKRCERMISKLQLDEKQAADFKKLNEKYAQQMTKEREAMKAEREKQQTKMLAMRDAHDKDVKKLLTEEQYKQYMERGRSGNGNKEGFERRKDMRGKSGKYDHRKGNGRRG